MAVAVSVGVGALSAVSDDILVNFKVLVGVEAVVGLALAAGGTEKTFLALAATAHARGVVRVVDTAQIASNFAPAAWDTGLVDAFVLVRGISSAAATSRCGG